MITVYIVILLALIMAIFGIIGYQRGIWPEVVSLVVLLAAFTVVEKSPQQLIGYMNGLFIGLMLVVKSGLNDLNAGDLESAAQKLRVIEKPFVEGYEGFALVIVMVTAAVVGYLLGLLIKKTKSVFGAALGILNGYILSAAFLPWLSGLSGSDLPVPLIRKGEGLVIETGRQAGEAATKLTLPTVLEWLSLEGGLPLVLLIALLAIFAIWRMRPKKA